MKTSTKIALWVAAVILGIVASIAPVAFGQPVTPGGVSAGTPVVGTTGTFSGVVTGSNFVGTSATNSTFAGPIVMASGQGITVAKEDGVSQKIGSGAGTIGLMGMLAARSTPVSNVSTGETDLQTVSLPINSLTTTGHCVSLKVRGVTVNNANVKTVKLYFGTTAILTGSMTISIAGAWTGDFNVCRTGSSAQRYDARLEEVNTGTNAVAKVFVTQGTLTENEANALTMKSTGTSGTASNDITANQTLTYWQ